MKIKHVKAADCWVVTEKTHNGKKEVFKQDWFSTKEEALCFIKNSKES